MKKTQKKVVYKCACGFQQQVTCFEGGDISTAVCLKCHPVTTKQRKVFSEEGIRFDKWSKRWKETKKDVN